VNHVAKHEFSSVYFLVLALKLESKGDFSTQTQLNTYSGKEAA
jgi:hypothetical protein